MKITVNSIMNYNQSSDPLLEVLAHNRSLRFRPFAPSEYNSDIHSAEYQCQARSESGATLSRKVTVTSGKFGEKKSLHLKIRDLFFHSKTKGISLSLIQLVSQFDRRGLVKI